ncbi:hypothetical protein TNCV_254441 [Trichonephila clavipes]|nr:hypothetical protein TNCV_254441 [Trichonephila clavipes]
MLTHRRRFSLKTRDENFRPKGKSVNIPLPGHGDFRPEGRWCGDANELGDAVGGPGEELPFLCKTRASLESRREETGTPPVEKARSLPPCPVRLRRPLKTEGELVIFVPGRTHIRSRSPR